MTHSPTCKGPTTTEDQSTRTPVAKRRIEEGEPHAAPLQQRKVEHEVKSRRGATDATPARDICKECGRLCTTKELEECLHCDSSVCSNCIDEHTEACRPRNTTQTTTATTTTTPTDHSSPVAFPRSIPIRANGTESSAVLDESSLSIGIGTWNINHLGEDTDEPKRRNKLAAIEELFHYNAWLELLVLQEVNKTGVPLLQQKLVRGTSPPKVLHSGPLLYTVSYQTEAECVVSHRATLENELPKQKKKRNRETLLKDVKRAKGTRFTTWYKTNRGTLRRYQEYFPLIARGDTKITVANVHLYWGTGHVTTPGTGTDVEVCYKDGDERTGDRVAESNGNRPIVVYELQKGKQTFLVGVVHTSPHGDEWYRAEIYDFQMKQVFAAVAGHIKAHKGHWILLGDYYLTPEARVLRRSEIPLTAAQDLNDDRNLLKATFEKRLPPELEIITAISGTNWKTAKQATKRSATAEPWKKFDQAQIADFLICSNNWETARAGLFKDRTLMASSTTGGLLVYDEYHVALRAWHAISDHAPVGALLSTVDDLRVLPILGYDEKTLDCAERNIDNIRDTWRREAEELRSELERTNPIVTASQPMPPKLRWKQQFRHAAQLKEFKKRLIWLGEYEHMWRPEDFAPTYRREDEEEEEGGEDERDPGGSSENEED